MTKHNRVDCRGSVLLVLIMLWLAGPALSAEPVPESEAEHFPTSAHRLTSSRPHDRISFIEGDAEAWSISNTAAGCYLMSPRRPGASRLAIGRHPVHGPGLFALGFAMSMFGPKAREPIGIETTPVALTKPGEMPAEGVLFVPLDAAEMAAGIKELRDSGTLWIRIRNTSLAHRGKRLEAALDAYVATCANTGGPPTSAEHAEGKLP